MYSVMSHARNIHSGYFLLRLHYQWSRNQGGGGGGTGGSA